MIKVQSLWIGEELGIFEMLCIKSYLKHGHKFILYTYSNLDTNISNPNLIIKDGNEIIPESSIFTYETGEISAFSNMFRYKLLYDRGGIWTDMDMICFKNLSPLIINKNYIFSSEISHSKKIQVPNTGIIMAPKGCKYMKLAYLNTKIIKKNGNLKWGSTGPIVLQKIINKNKLENYVVSYKIFCPINYTNLNKLININYDEIKTSYCIHLWNQIWNVEKRDKNDILKNKIFLSIFND